MLCLFTSDHVEYTWNGPHLLWMVQPIRSPENPGTTVVSFGHLTPWPENPGYRTQVWDNTMDRCDVHAKGQGQRSKVKVTEVMTPLSHFRTVTSVWIHMWQWNDTQSLMLPIVFQGHPSNFKVTRYQKSPILTQIGRFQTVTWIWIHRWQWNDAQCLK